MVYVRPSTFDKFFAKLDVPFFEQWRITVHSVQVTAQTPRG